MKKKYIYEKKKVWRGKKKKKLGDIYIYMVLQALSEYPINPISDPNTETAILIIGGAF